MADIITQEDLILVLSQSASPKLDLKIEVLDSFSGKVIDTINGAVSGSMSINSESDVRRDRKSVV